jgi:pimeloyl-ACP methyl ester carboxylesterase
MTPFFFGADEEPLFGVYAPPRASAARDAAVLLCAPIGIEYQRTHYAIRLAGIQLARAGFHVLRFDYRGTGDSGGKVGPGQFDCWVDDIAVAARELVEISAAQNLIVIGLRMGAALALEALATKNIKATAIVLWDPVVSGCEFLLTLETLQAELASTRSVPVKPTDELLGARFPQDLRTAIQGITLDENPSLPEVKSAALIVSEDNSEFRALLERMRSRCPDTMYRPLSEPVRWNTISAAYEGRMTGPIIRAVSEAVESLG